MLLKGNNDLLCLLLLLKLEPSHYSKDPVLGESFLFLPRVLSDDLLTPELRGPASELAASCCCIRVGVSTVFGASTRTGDLVVTCSLVVVFSLDYLLS